MNTTSNTTSNTTLNSFNGIKNEKSKVKENRNESENKNKNKNSGISHANKIQVPMKIFSSQKLLEESLCLLLRTWTHNSTYIHDTNTHTDNNFQNSNKNSNKNLNNHQNTNKNLNDNYYDNDNDNCGDNCRDKNMSERGGKNGVLGGNFVRDVAMIHVAEILLNQINDLEIMFTTENDNNINNIDNIDNNYNDNHNNNDYENNYDYENKENNENNSNKIDKIKDIHDNENTKPHTSFLLLPSSIFKKNKNRCKKYIERILQKLLYGMFSMHSKIATQSISVLQNNSILLKYFVTVNSDIETIEQEHGNRSKTVIFSEELLNWRQDQLDKLVEILRKNRNHWHPIVKDSSAEFFDILLNYLE